MACRRCGCRMIAKVGRAHPMLICTDCGLPMDQRESQALARQRLWSAITLMVLATVGGAMALLAAMNEVRTARPLEDGWERKEEGATDGREEKSELFLVEPSGLTESMKRPADRLGPRHAEDAGRKAAASAAEKPVAEASEDKPKRQPQAERQP